MWLRRVGIEQEVAKAAREVLAGSWTPTDLRNLGGDDPWSHPAWSTVREMGWLDLLVPEDLGGLGLGPVEAGAVFEEAGRALFPGPLFGSMVVGARCREVGLSQAGTSVAIAYAEADSGGLPAWSSTRWRDGRLSGSKHLVEFADAAELLVVVAGGGARSDPTIVAVDPSQPGVDVRMRPGIDAAFRVADVGFDGAAADVVRPADGGRAWIAEVGSLARCLYASRLLGVSDRLVELAVDHARTREQFDRPIGSFQAVQHLLADLKVATETARSACYVSQASLAESAPEAGRRASIAKGYASRVGRQVAEGALQVLGGIGFAAEHDLHLYYKHALSLQGAWGDERHHQDQLAHRLIERIRRDHVGVASR